MKLHFLGTSSGTPTRSRNVTGLALQYDGCRSWDLFDCGEGTQHQLLHTSLSLHGLGRIFISHLHGDHCFGLFGLLGSRAMLGATTAVTLFGPAGLEEMVRSVLTLSASHLGFELVFVVVGDDGGCVVESGPVAVTAIPLVHRVQSFAWFLEEQPRPGAFDAAGARALGVTPGPMFGRLKRGESVTLTNGNVVHGTALVGADEPGRRLIVAGDNSDPQRLLAHSGAVQLLVHEATYTQETVAHNGSDHGHSTAERVAQASRSAGVSNLILTHFSPRYQGDLSPLRMEAEAAFEGAVVLANDFDVYELGRAGELSKMSP